MSISEEKTRLRGQARTARLNVSRVNAASDLSANFTALLEDADFPGPPAVIAGYWAMGGEIDAEPLLGHLAGLGFDCALPVVTSAEAPLTFRRWRPGMVLEDGAHGTRQPPPQSPQLTPAVVLCPLLAFDGHGTRLGQGGGHYDRTLQALRGAGPLLAVGLAFAAQRVDTVPHDGHDQPLDWVVTEEQVLKAENGS